MRWRDSFPLSRLILTVTAAFLAVEFRLLSIGLSTVLWLIGFLVIPFIILIRSRRGQDLGFCNFASMHLLIFLVYCWRFDQGILREHAYQSTDILLVDEIIEKPGKRVQIICHPAGDASQFRMLIFWMDTIEAAFQTGDLLALGSPIGTIKKDSGANFDFYKYYRQQGISRRSFSRQADLVKLGHVSNWQLLVNGRVNRIRNQVRSKFLQVFGETKSKNYALALMLGDRSALNNDMRKKFSAIGIAHVLAVSGMHLGLMFFLLDFVMRKLLGLKKRNLLYPLAMLFCIWSYAMLTGLGVSVQRAGVMLSIYLLGTVINRRSKSLNVWVLTVLLMAYVDPRVLHEPGFQLSVMAVLGILVLGIPLSRSLQFRFRLAQWTWNSVSISVAAHLFTFPLVAYHFHQHANCFLLANLLIVPLFILLIYLCIGTFLFGLFWASVSQRILAISGPLIESIECLAVQVYEMPYATFTVDNFSVSLLIEIYALLFVWMFAFQRASVNYLKLAAFYSVVLMLIIW